MQRMADLEKWMDWYMSDANVKDREKLKAAGFDHRSCILPGARANGVPSVKVFHSKDNEL